MMDNEMTLYRLTRDGVIRQHDGACIPTHSGNRDYQAYLAWCAVGNEAAPLHSISDAHSIKLSKLDAACAAAILAGFSANALGQPHHYPAQPTDQSNLQAAVLDSLQPSLPADWTAPVWCQDASGVWAYREHTATQIQQVGSAARQAVNACITRKLELARQLAQATSLDEIAAVTW